MRFLDQLDLILILQKWTWFLPNTYVTFCIFTTWKSIENTPILTSYNRSWTFLSKSIYNLPYIFSNCVFYCAFWSLILYIGPKYFWNRILYFMLKLVILIKAKRPYIFTAGKKYDKGCLQSWYLIWYYNPENFLFESLFHKNLKVNL